MHTIKEAENLWCPKATAEMPNDHTPSANRHDDGHFKSQCHCLADKCMWWRWEAGDAPKKGFCGAVFHAPWV